MIYQLLRDGEPVVVYGTPERAAMGLEFFQTEYPAHVWAMVTR